jgi:hypothetical protein
MEALAHASDSQDHYGGVLLMANVFGIYSFLLKLYACAGNRGPKFRHELARVTRGVNVEIFRRCDAGDFVVLLNRRIVTRDAMILAVNLA